MTRKDPLDTAGNRANKDVTVRFPGFISKCMVLNSSIMRILLVLLFFSTSKGYYFCANYGLKDLKTSWD